MALNINQRLNGLHALSYMGDNAVQPPDFVTKARPPTPNDSKNFALGDIWLDTSGYPVSVPTAEDVYMLVALIGNNATWVNFAGGISDLNTVTGDDGVVVFPTPAGNINFFAQPLAGSSITFSGSANTLSLNTTDAFGNTFIGAASGSTANTGGENTGLGYGSGSNYTSTESSNISISNVGVALESNTIRIGAQGSNPGQQNRNFQAGIYNTTPAVANPLNVVIDSAGQLGTAPINGASTASFSAYLSVDALNQTGNDNNVTVICDTKVFDTNNNYNNATGVFVAPADGVYQFCTTVSITNLGAAMTAGLFSFLITGGPSAGTWTLCRNNPYATQDLQANVWRYNGSLCTYMNAGNNCRVVLNVVGGPANTVTIFRGPILGGTATWFSGCKLA